MRRRTQLMNVEFVNNVANEGGALHITSCRLANNIIIMLTECLFIGNSAHRSGGALFATRCMGNGIIISKSVFFKCLADFGGAMTVENSNIKLEKSELRENRAKTTTSGMHVMWRDNVENRVLIHSSSFDDNNAPSLFIYAHKISITKSNFTATTDSPINHINVNGFKLSVRSINVNLVYTKLPQSNTELGFMSLTSQSGKMNVTGLNISCSRFFHLKFSQTKVLSTLQKTKPN